mgnify:CR=1 FL=1
MSAIDRLHVAAAGYRAVGALMIPGEDAHIINREDFSLLMGLLNDIIAEAVAELTRPTPI